MQCVPFFHSSYFFNMSASAVRSLSLIQGRIEWVTVYWMRHSGVKHVLCCWFSLETRLPRRVAFFLWICSHSGFLVFCCCYLHIRWNTHRSHGTIMGCIHACVCIMMKLWNGSICMILDISKDRLPVVRLISRRWTEQPVTFQHIFISDTQFSHVLID